MPYHGCSGLDEPVESELRCLADSCTQLIIHVLLVEAQLVQHTDEEAVLLLRVVLALVCAVLDSQLVEWRLVAHHLGIQGALDADSTLDFGLSALYLCHYLLNVL